MADTLFDIEMLKTLKDITLPDPAEIEYWKLAENRTFFIDYEIEDDYRLMELGKTIIRMNIEEKDIPINELKPITLFVFSYGGNLDLSIAFCDIVEMSRIPIITVCTGVAMSAGFLIFLSGHKRYAMKQSVFLAHQGWAEFSGTAAEIEASQKNYKETLDKMRDYILSHTSIDKKSFDRNKNKDWYISGKDKIESYGIAKIITTFEEIK